MTKNSEPINIDQLLAEADELMHQINSGAIGYMKEDHRLEFEKHAQDLEKIRSETKGDIQKKKNSGAEGMHEALQDIVKAMRALTKYLS